MTRTFERGFFPMLLLAGGALSLLFSWHPTGLRVLVCLSAMAYAPGRMILGAWAPALPKLEKIPLAFAFSLIWAAPFFIGGSLLRADTFDVTRVYAISSLLLGAFLWIWKVFRENKKARTSTLWNSCDEKSSQSMPLWLKCLCLGLACYFAFFTHSFNTDDVLDISPIRTLAAGTLEPNYPFYRPAVPMPEYGYELRDPLLAGAACMAGVDALQLWLLLPALTAPLLLIAIYVFLRKLFSGEKRALGWSIAAFVFFYLLLERGWVFQTSSEYMVLTGLVLMPLCWRWTFTWSESKEKQALLFAIVPALALSFIHPAALIITGCVLAFYVVALWLRVSERGPALRVAAMLCLWAVLVSPYVFLRLSLYRVAFTNPEFYQPWQAVTVFSKYFIMNPAVYFAPHYLVKPPFEPRVLILLGYAAFPWLFLRGAWTRARLFIVASFVGTALLLSNPFVYPWLGKLVTYQLLRRLTHGVQFIPAIGLVLASIDKGRVRKWLRGISLVGAMVLIVTAAPWRLPSPNPHLSPWKARWIQNPYEPKLLLNPSEAYPLLRFLRRLPVQGVTVADDPDTFWVLAYTSRRVLVLKDAYVSVAIRDQARRKRLRSRIYLSDTLTPNLQKNLDLYHVECLIFDAKRWRQIGGWDGAKKFLRSPKWKKAYEDGRFLVVLRNKTSFLHSHGPA